MSAETLATIWFALWGLLWAVYFTLDGFDLGVGMLYPFLARSKGDSSNLVAAIGPFWDANEVWLLTAGGATFAAFPNVYAALFSSLYTPLMLLLVGLIFRAAALEFMHKSEGEGWQKTWGWILSAASFLVTLLLGVAFGNLFQGLPIDEAGYHGTLPGLLNPYGLLTGLLFVLAFLLSGSLWLTMRAEGRLQERARSVATRAWIATLLAAVAFLAFTGAATRLYDNYLKTPAWFAVPALAVLALVSVRFFLSRQRHLPAFLGTSLTILATTFTGIIGLFPQMIPSSLGTQYSLTAFNSAASPYTLKIMLAVVLIFVPIVLAYKAWMYSVFGGKLQDAEY